MIGEINTKPQAGGIDIQGIINQYEIQSGGNISAGDFVEFINDWSNVNTGQTTTIDNYSMGSTNRYMGGVLIEKNKAFIQYIKGTANIYGIVCTINETTITIGTATSIIPTYNSSSYYDTALVKIDTNKVCITYNDKDSTTATYGIVCTISGTTISVGYAQLINNRGYNSKQLALIDDNKILSISSSTTGSTKHCYAKVCTISGTTISVGNATEIRKDNSNYTSYGLTTIDTNKCFVSVSGYGSILTISGNTITQGAFTNKEYTMYNLHSTPVALIDDNKIISIDSGSNNELYARIGTIEGTTITSGTRTLISNSTNSSLGVSIIKTKNNKVYIIHQHDNNDGYVYGIECTINGTNISVGTDTTLVNKNITYGQLYSFLVDDRKIFTFYGHYANSIAGLYGIIITPSNNPYITSITTSSQKISGVAQEDGSGGDTIDVIEPYTS